MLGAESYRLEGLLDSGHCSFPHHLEHGGFGIDAPAGGSGARPTAAVEVLAGLAVGRQGIELWALGIRETDNGGEARSISTRLVRARCIHGMGARKGMPGNIVEKMMVHRCVYAAGSRF